MDRREIVERAITFNDAPRVPFKFDVVGVNDCYDVWTGDPTGWSWAFEGERADEWACVWKRTEVQNTGQVAEHPLKDLNALEDFVWPNADDPRRYAGFEQQLAGAEDRFVMFCFGNGIWERLHMLHGMSESLMDFYVRPNEMHEIIERILDHHLRVFRRCAGIAAGRMHAAAMADDWGLQDRAFISVDLFREFFKPRYKRWFDEIKAAGMHPWMHSCGRINEILEELIDCGLEVINMQQPTVVGIEEIGRRYRGRICFESIVDTQSTLPRGTYDEIRRQARGLLDAWATPKGGFIVSDYNDAEAIGVTFDRRLVMFEAFAEKAGYPDWRRIVEEARRRGERVGHSWGRQSMGERASETH
jgi:uroporphyrinogen decarboxylase